jgi:hypothetical protein
VTEDVRGKDDEGKGRIGQQDRLTELMRSDETEGHKLNVSTRSDDEGDETEGHKLNVSTRSDDEGDETEGHKLNVSTRSDDEGDETEGH